MPSINIYDPPLCCSTGVCGPAVDPALARLAADIAWLKGRGVSVARFNLAQEPAAFADNDVVRVAMHGGDALPFTLVDGCIAMRGTYPTREQLAAFAGVPFEADTGQKKSACGCQTAPGGSSCC